jgi:short-subunit dehydrogenase
VDRTAPERGGPVYSRAMPHLPSDGFVDRYGPWALVLGASEGIGAAFAHELARRRLPVVLVARDAERLEALAGRLREEHGTSVRSVACDLGAPEAVERVAGQVRDVDVGLVVYNAASSPVGRFLDTPLEAHLRAVDVNARSPVAFAHRFGGPMAKRGRGGIVLMSSLTAFQGTPLVASYGATKAFNLVLAEGLWDELRERGVDVLACCAGATLTPGYLRATPDRPAGLLAPKPQDPGEVAREALAALGRGPFVVTGRGNRFVSCVMRRLMSRRSAVVTIGREMRRRYGR